MFSGKLHREWNPFIHKTSKPVRNYIPNEMDPNFHGTVPKPEHKLRGKELFDANLLKTSVNPRGLESLQYGWGKGMPSFQATEPSDIAHQARNGRSTESVNNLDFANYYKATK